MSNCALTWARIETRYGLNGPGIESRWGARFFTPAQTGPGAHSASYTINTKSFPRITRPGRWPPNPSNAEVKGRVELYLSSPSGPSCPVLGWTLFLPLPLPFFFIRARSIRSRCTADYKAFCALLQHYIESSEEALHSPGTSHSDCRLRRPENWRWRE